MGEKNKKDQEVNHVCAKRKFPRALSKGIPKKNSKIISSRTQLK